MPKISKISRHLIETLFCCHDNVHVDCPAAALFSWEVRTFVETMSMPFFFCNNQSFKRRGKFFHSCTLQSLNANTASRHNLKITIIICGLWKWYTKIVGWSTWNMLCLCRKSNLCKLKITLQLFSVTISQE